MPRRSIPFTSRDSSIQNVAKEFHLDWKTVKALEKQYLREQLRRAGTPGPKIIGIDEGSLRNGHTYRIVVSDLGRKRSSWFGGEDRSEKSLDLFFGWLGEKKSQGVQLAVMDMWKTFHNSTRKHVPQAPILFYKFHVLRYLHQGVEVYPAFSAREPGYRGPVRLTDVPVRSYP